MFVAFLHVRLLGVDPWTKSSRSFSNKSKYFQFKNQQSLILSTYPLKIKKILFQIILQPLKTPNFQNMLSNFR
jgi:hypothetical protein